MEIVRTEGNRELVYELVYDYDKVVMLIKEIIENCSITKRDRFVVETRAWEVEDVINNTMIWDNFKMYSNVSDIKAEPINDPCDYWRHGDPAPYSFLADKLVVPELVHFLIRVINNENVDFDWFVNNKELDRKKDLELEIKKLDLEIDKISNFETEKKIDMLTELYRKVKVLKNIPEFDYDVLAGYYAKAKEVVKLELVQETIKYRKRNK